ncbi:MAG: hypothetical protein GWO20_19120 [Candidatus Korarchaeota archaeon]|nr:hypothetical protein [Candidatus Korarchaeota archaeon]NIU85368.1 hypothetical protein [Candidatus Thorarchaeota archaeon]NIW15466.1 hypothetical protein [Candidatus Thorarchaeota archaeon]NIW53410.1 hypothetical protein [Candidatus Korarchaeota archaeon]
MKKVLQWELQGMVFIIFLGSFLHFAFELSGGWWPIGIIAAVNESVFEHLKLGIWPAFFYTILESKQVRGDTTNFGVAKAASMYLIPLTIVVLFYSYTTILGHGLLAIDIAIFIIAVVVGQGVSYKLLTSFSLHEKWERVAWLAMLVLLLVTVLFTFFPPHLAIFQDSTTGDYGIPS